MIYIIYKYRHVEHNYYLKLPEDKAQLLLNELWNKAGCEWVKLESNIGLSNKKLQAVRL